mmetsp:Transcript_1804/g.7468  ORF Transcript_1804/g.7468 Transcript_1804/m.7468 type:complete len:234 (-) Transcript_1804:1274-1975(-)
MRGALRQALAPHRRERAVQRPDDARLRQHRAHAVAAVDQERGASSGVRELVGDPKKQRRDGVLEPLDVLLNLPEVRQGVSGRREHRGGEVGEATGHGVRRGVVRPQARHLRGVRRRSRRRREVRVKRGFALGPQRELDAVQVAVQARDAPAAHDGLVLGVHAEHEHQPHHVVIPAAQQVVRHGGRPPGQHLLVHHRRRGAEDVGERRRRVAVLPEELLAEQKLKRRHVHQQLV